MKKNPRLLNTLTMGNKTIRFVENLDMSDDGWFISVNITSSKNKNYKQTSCITLKQMPVLIEFYKGQGYVQA